MKRRALGFGLAVLTALAMAGCGDPIDDYCETIRDHRVELNEMVDAGEEYGLITHLPMLREIADEAPDDIRDEWQTFLAAVENLAATLDELGHAPEDFADGRTPEGLSAADKAQLKAAADRLTSQDTVAATGGIDQQVRDVCKVNLGG